jgi:hypothetical protein
MSHYYSSKKKHIAQNYRISICTKYKMLSGWWHFLSSSPGHCCPDGRQRSGKQAAPMCLLPRHFAICRVAEVNLFIHLTTLSVGQNMEFRKIEWLMNNELETIQNKAVVARESTLDVWRDRWKPKNDLWILFTCFINWQILKNQSQGTGFAWSIWTNMQPREGPYFKMYGLLTLMFRQ